MQEWVCNALAYVIENEECRKDFRRLKGVEALLELLNCKAQLVGSFVIYVLSKHVIICLYRFKRLRALPCPCLRMTLNVVEKFE